MNKSLKLILRVGLLLGLMFLIVNIERYIERMYLQSDVTHSFLLHWPLYLVISIIFVLAYWRFELKNIKSNILKICHGFILFGFIFYESNRIMLWINSKAQADVIHQEYKLKLVGLAYGEIGIEDFENIEYHVIKASVSETEGLSEGDKVKIQFNVGIFGFKNAPTLIKE